ncbi:aldo/keto reductase [Maritimibacter sp. 55A14]|uniref:aldo/keto reductase n=1 Tax=Maritimibacter sp. 55A14 TaxID=2174844 RepID=UPI000D60E59A|nr:aldo/keto reductase [Maritimibacter sp. 55A14]PWE33854.1 aldo/keto reductase [Maritimibacter sp. 55A14]
MRMNELGRTGLQISEFCLGTMTFGTQTPPEDAHTQIDMALDAGINMLDTAEMYPVNPVSAETVGLSERIIGDWVAKSGRRDELLIATKVSGAGNKAVRDGAPVSRATVLEAVDGSLSRLRCDHIDLYQIHWPNRGSYMFRQNWDYDPSGQDRAETAAHMAEVAETLAELVQAGKIRHFGLSNESAWGTMQWLRAAEAHGAPRVASVQNEYSLLCRLYDTDMAELSANEDVGLLAFSPLAAGLLSGKYAGDVTPEGTRRVYNPTLGGRITPRVWEAISAYLALAAEHDLDPVQMALAWAARRPFTASAIFGATSVAQLRRALGAARLDLPPELLAEIDATHRAHPMPY